MLNHGCSRGHTLNFTNCSDLAPTIIAMYYSPPGLKRSGTDNSGFAPCFFYRHLNNSHRAPYQKLLLFRSLADWEYAGGKTLHCCALLTRIRKAAVCALKVLQKGIQLSRPYSYHLGPLFTTCNPKSIHLSRLLI